MNATKPITATRRLIASITTEVIVVNVKTVSQVMGSNVMVSEKQV